jgi:hypothetical protein
VFTKVIKMPSWEEGLGAEWFNDKREGAQALLEEGTLVKVENVSKEQM